MRRWQVPLGLLVSTTSGCVVAKDGQWSFGAGIDRVVLELGSGDVEVVPSGSDRTHLDLDFGGVTVSDVGPERTGDTLWVDLYCDGVCGGDAVLEVPDDIAVDVRVHRGDLWVDGLTGGRLDAMVGAGDLSVEGLQVPRVAVSVGAGDGSVSLDSVGCVTVQLGAGDASLELPAGAYDLDVSVDTGALDVGRGIVRDPQADRCVDGHVQAGHLSLQAH